MDEREYLQKEAAKARDAMKSTAVGIWQDLEKTANPAQWTRDYPLSALLIATAAGFVAAAFVAPLVSLRGRVKLRSKPGESDQNGHSESAAGPALSFIKAELLTLATDVAGKALKALLKQSAADSTPQTSPETNAPCPDGSPENVPDPPSSTS